jgi:hypothetical protein
MPSQPEFPLSAARLVDYVDAHGGTDEAMLLLEIVLASSHPDFVMSLASARLLPLELREAVCDFVRYVLLDGLTASKQQSLFSWAQRKMLAGPGSTRPSS